MFNRYLSFSFISALSIACLFAVNRCGSDDSSSLGDVSLSSLPSTSAMLQGNGTYGIANKAINLQSVSGTPPYLKDLSSSNSSTYFWNGLVTTINNASTCSAQNKSKFWGQDTATPGPGGQGACMMAQGVGEALARMMEGGSTMCYMKGITSAAGVTVTGGEQSQIFKQSSGNKTIKINVTNMSQSRPSMSVFFTILGTNAVGGAVYKYDMFMCQSGSITSKESLEVNKTTKVMTSTMYNNEGSARGYNQVVAYLKNNGSTLTFDTTKSRTAISKWTGTWGDYLGQVEITGDDLIKAQRYGSNATWGKNKTYSVSAFSGSSVDTFAFRQGCFKGQSTSADNANNWSYSGITEYRDTFYAAVASSDLSPQCDAFTLGSDGIFADTTVPTMDTTGLDCNMTTDITVDMDFSLASVLAIQAECDGDKRKLANYSMCDTNAIRTAEAYCRQ